MRKTTMALRAYRRWGALATPTRSVVARRMRQCMAQDQPDRVLEVGGGTGILRGILSGNSATYICSDIAPTESTDVVCDGLALPFRHESFDLVASFEVMEHIADTDAFLRELHRVARSGGVVALSVPFMYGVHDYVDYYRFTPAGLIKKLADHGFRTREVVPVAGTLTTIVVLFANWIRQQVVGDSQGWRTRGRRRQAQLLLGTAMTSPLTPLVWLTALADKFVDRHSASPVGFVLTAVKTVPPLNTE